jgi:AcrR family transcriptional regulator
MGRHGSHPAPVAGILMGGKDKGRPQQRLRTRKDLLQAAARLMRKGGQPSLEDVAAEAMVSRATAYRYFPDVGALLAEASLDVDVPDAEALFGDDATLDPVARLEMVDAAMHDAVTENEAQMRRMLAHAVTRALDASPGDGTPPRQNPRTIHSGSDAPPRVRTGARPGHRRRDRGQGCPAHRRRRASPGKALGHPGSCGGRTQAASLRPPVRAGRIFVRY